MNGYTFPELFMKQVTAHSSKTAITDPAAGRQMTYAELDLYSGRIAAKMRKNGVVHGDIVVLVMPNSLDEVAAMLAAMKLGAAFVPLNPSYPEERLNYIYKDCSAKLVVTQDFFTDIKDYSVIENEGSVSGDDIAMLIYTSGSTGHPKGVVINQNAVCESIDPIVCEADVFGLGAPFYFIAGCWTLFEGMAIGSTCILIPAEIMRDPGLLAQFLKEYCITATFISPKILRYFKPASNDLRKVITGSERLSGIYSDKYELFNRYAMSETSGQGLQFLVDRSYDNTPVGKPTGNGYVYILDDNGQEAEEGEICLTGRFATGYLNLPEETAKTFVPNPFKDRDGYETMIKTGDMGRRLPDGNIVYLNRKDWMVKINGQRVEPGEIEAELRRIAGITDAAVKDFTDESGQVTLIAYYVASDEREETELRRILGERLPEYMIPSAFVQMERLPLNANGKLDRNALQKPSQKCDESELPQNEVQQKIYDCAAEAIGHTDFGITTDLYSAGLNSISSIRLTVLLGKSFGVPVSIQDLQSCSTVQTLEGFFTGQTAFEKHEIQDDYPLTQTQMGILVESLSHPDTSIYNIPVLIKLSDQVDLLRLKDAVECALAAHPYMNAAVFADDDGNYRVKRNDPLSSPVEIIKTGQLPDYLVKPFNLLEERLYRVSIFDTDNGNYLFIDCHHIIFDGTSFMILYRDIEAAYNGQDVEPEDYTGFEIALDELSLQKTESFEKARTYYEKLLADVEKDMLPKGDMSENQPRPGFLTIPSELDKSAVCSWCREHHLTENAFYNSVFAFVLSRYIFLDEVLYTTIYNGRKDSRMERTVSMLVNTLPVVSRINGNMRTEDLVRSIGDQLMNSMAGDIYSFAEISRSFNVSSDIMFAYQGDNFSVDSFAGKETEVQSLQLDEAKGVFDVTVYVRDEHVYFECEYRADRYSGAFMQGFVDAMVQAARGFIQEEYLKDVSILSDEAGSKINTYNDTDYDIPLIACHRLLEVQTAAHPERLAVIASGVTITYEELNRRSNLIANALIKRGVQLNETVGMLMPRTVDAVAVEYGIMKAGGAFLPMLPDYPDDRIDYCMTDSGSRFVLTTGQIISERAELFDGKTYIAIPVAQLFEEDVANNPDTDVPPDALAYCIYTSGSTGRPKGVMIEHKNLCNFVNANIKNRECYNFVSAGKTALSVAALSFDFSLMEIHLTLANGMTLCMASDEEIRNPLALAKLIKENGVDVISGTPSFLSNILDIPEAAEALSGIRLYDLGAEAFPPVLYSRLKEVSPSAMIVNGYGPTEATISCISKVVEDRENITIGQPAANVKAWIIDRAGNILPPFARGELVIGGLGVGRGYVNLPDKTKEVFIDLAGYRAYRTGDVARINGDGEIEFFGRLDNQVKLHGLRIELDEIENVIVSYPGINRSIVMVRKNEAGDDCLCAWFTAAGTVDTSELKDYISKQLARYMIPAAFVQLDQIPMTQNGKVDKKRLPDPVIKQEAFVLPENEVQQKIFECVSGVLGHNRFGVDTDLYDAGLSSLGAIRLNVLLSKAFDVPVSIRDLQENATVRLLEKILKSKEPVDTWEILPDYPLTQTQTGILVESLEHPGSTIYNIPSLYRLSDAVDLRRLKASIEEALNAHPYLKATLFADDNGNIRAKRNDETEVAVDIVEIDDLPEDLIKPFEMLGGPLFRISLYATGKGNYLFMDLHHIVFDGTSESILLNDINAAYKGNPVEKESFSGFEMALEEEKLRDTEQYTQAKDWYDEMLSDADREMLPDGDISGQEHSSSKLIYGTSLDPKVVHSFCEEHSITENAFFNAAFAFSLSRFTGKSEALYTTIYNGRNDSRLDRTVSMLVKTFPVRVNVTPGQDVTGFLSDIGKLLVDNMNHDIFPFAEIVRTYGISSDVMFVWQGSNETSVTIGGELAELIPLRLDEAKAPLMLQAFLSDGRIQIDCEFHSDRYSECFIRIFAGCVEQTAKQLMTSSTLGEISLLTSETEAEMDTFNATAKDYVVTDIVSMFRAAAEKYSERCAVIFKDETLTYREVDDISERIAGYLCSHGIGRGDVISILIPRCVYMATASLGVLKTGAAYQPLDPSYPSERLSFMMKDASCKLLIADEELLDKVPDYTGDILLTRDIPSLPECEKTEEHPSPEDLFILLYTSGSTGVPKGVMLEHRNLANFCNWYREYYKLDETSRVAAYASYGFDACMMDMYPALATGACVCIVEEETRLDLMALEEWFKKQGITHAFMTTQVCRQFYTMTDTPDLKYLSAGGEKLVPVIPKDGNPVLFNGYGPTECTIFSTVMPVERLFDRIPIGKPLSNYKLYVVDENLHRLPPLVPGELLIAGRGVGRGYLNRPELTEKAFIRNPFSDEPDYARAYRTGDVVRLLPDGNIDFIGRNDGQVKVRGFRIELTEVEGVIREFPGIKDATVQAFEDEQTGEKYLAAYVVSDADVDISAMNDFIRERKPAYMVPAVMMQIPSIPLNQNQKVNRRALPKPVRTQGERENIVAPQNETQHKIFDCIAEVVGHKEFGINTNIYEAGLSSIGAIRLNVLLSKAFDVSVNSRDLKANPTVEKLEAFLSGAEKAEAFEIKADYGLTRTQEGIYVESIAKPGATVYNVPVLLKISDDIDLDRLKTAITVAVNAHPVLKTRLFINDDGDVRMRRMDGDYSFDENAINVRQNVDIEAEKAALVKPFNLIGGRLFRAELLQGGGTWLFIEAHHIVADGSSLNVLLNDISRAYAGEAVEPESFTAYDVVLNEEKLRSGGALEDAKAYYEQLLAEAETVNLPAGDIQDADGIRTGNLTVKSVTPLESFKRFCDENRCSMNGLFSSAFGLVLDKYLGVDAAAFTGIYSGRNDSRFINTVAMLVKTLPIVVTQRENITPAELVREVTKQLTDSQNSDIYSFAEISRALRVNADVMFAWQGDEFAFDTLCGEPAKMEELGLSEAKAPVNLNVVINNGEICYLMEYRSDIYSEVWMRGFVDAVDSAVNGLITFAKLEEVSILSKNASDQLRKYNDTFEVCKYPAAPELFLKAVSDYGQKTAVIARSGSVKLTYEELGRRALKIAGALLKAGVKPGERVALYMDRTEDVYAIRQGIMLAGGAFVSLEPDYPDDRISYIIKDAGITRLVTEKTLYSSRTELFRSLEMMILDDIYGLDDLNTDLPDIDPDSPAYCIYTSGSTGNPKGVEILHRNLANLLHYDEKNTLARAYVDNSTAFLALAAITFDVSVIEEMMPLLHGHTVVIATQEEIHNPLLLMRTVKSTGVDMMKCTPSYLQTILDVQEAREALSGLNALIVGAEPFPAVMYKRIREAGFAGMLFNSYGPTETCVSVCIGVLDGRTVTIGGPSLNTAFLIRDKYGNILPPFARGELVIAGEQVGRGYINLPEQTRDKFICINYEGRALNAYRSGDIAYFNYDGMVIHCGRNDNQVKIRGLRIELDGVENVMNSFPGIKRSVVLVKGEGDGKFLCGYYVSESPVDEEALVKHMRQTLTGYMVPGVFVHMTDLPMTVNGKVNKKALPEPQVRQDTGSRKEPSGQLQKQIAEMFAKALGVQSVGADEDFFEIGGTSILASKVAMQAMIAGLPIAYQDIFANPTVEALEQFVLGKKTFGADDGGKPVKEAAHEVQAWQEREIEEIKDALRCNTMDHINNMALGDLGHVLLTGATGFLGIHVLRELLDNTSCKVTCLIRKGRASSVQKRLETMLVYYFDKDYREAFNSGRLDVIDGDITNAELVMAQQDLGFKTLINCAANVKHFANDDILERVNVTGVKNLIALCEKTGSRLVQISTVSVAGENVDHALPDTLVLKENMLYFGQDLSNQYVKSKFDAEEAVLRAVSAGRLRAKIVRVGNLMSRLSDGEFQANFVTSGFMRSLRGYAVIGAFPVSALASPVEFSPIDKVAEAVRILAGTPDQFTVFHAVNGHWIEMGDVIAAMNEAGLPVENVSDEEFSYRLSQALKDEHKNMLVSGLISYLSSDAETVRSYVSEEHDFSKNALYRLGFRWPLTDDNYLNGAIRALASLGFFES